MHKLVPSALAALVLAAPALPAAAAADTYVIDGGHTFPRFSYDHLGFSTKLSRFDKTSGTIVIDRAAKRGSVDVTIDTTSVDTGNNLFNTHIQDADFLDTSRYPTATFKSSRLNFDGDRLASIDGSLTLKGVTRPVTLTVTSFHCKPHPMLKRDACGANASAVVKRSDFNAGKYVPAVGDEVTLSIAVEAIRE